ncbi:MAG: hypothetical protein JSS09_02535 [Verrucomicrobia bacterium]|nr:hypothetical protein [Verrucomicrobiota bacterium]
MNLELIFQSLIGGWSIERNIHSFEGNLLGTFVGKALYKEISPHLLHYREEGLLHSEQCKSCAFKEYYFVYDGEIKIYFDLKLARLFHKMEYEVSDTYPFYAKGVHYCGNDVYDMSYVFTSKQEYTTTISVKGPRKSYLIQSVFLKSSLF